MQNINKGTSKLENGDETKARIIMTATDLVKNINKVDATIIVRIDKDGQLHAIALGRISALKMIVDQPLPELSDMITKQYNDIANQTIDDFLNKLTDSTSTPEEANAAQIANSFINKLRQ